MTNGAKVPREQNARGHRGVVRSALKTIHSSNERDARLLLPVARRSAKEIPNRCQPNRAPGERKLDPEIALTLGIRQLFDSSNGFRLQGQTGPKRHECAETTNRTIPCLNQRRKRQNHTLMDPQ